MNHVANPEPSPGVLQLLRDLVHELGTYIRDATQLLSGELQVQARVLGTLAALALAGVLFSGAAFLLFSLAIVAAVAHAVQSWGVALLLVGALYSLLAGGFGWAVRRLLQTQPLRFPRTWERVRSDAEYFKEKLAA